MTRTTANEASRSLGRPGFQLDLGRCVGCGACVLACRIENGLSAGVSWRRVLPVNGPRVDGGPTYHLSVACHHCLNPPCVLACPTGALEKRSDGIVVLGSDRCIGCRYCEMACSFGAPAFDTRTGIMTKCHLCHHRLAEGLDPACVVACPTEALEYTGTGLESSAVRATDTPGFGDPAGAEPGFWVVEPGGAARSKWYAKLKSLLGLNVEDSDEPK